MDRYTCKTLMVWLVVGVGAVSGCRCAPKTNPEAGMMDSGIGEPCSDLMPCRQGLYCLGGMCTADCSAENPCPAGAMCTTDGHCIGGACAADPPLTGCGDGCSLTRPCPSGLYCHAGLCTADCSADVPCPNGQTCSASGECMGGGNDAGVCSSFDAPVGCGDACSASAPCPSGLYCLGGMCTADCTITTPCASGAMCTADGHCSGGSSDAGVSTMDTGICTGVTAPSGCGDSCSASSPCPVGLYCSGGRCTVDCTPAFPCANGGSCTTDGHCIGGGSDSGTHLDCVPIQEMECGGVCVQRLHDPNNCGTCGHVCPGVQVCTGGTCADMCPSNRMDCSRACVDTMTDPDNCGSCGHACPNNLLCLDGICGCATTRGQTLCDDHCVILDSDRINCGSCGHECTTTCASRARTCVSQGIACGPAGDGCGNMLDCGMCTAPGDTCGGGGVLGQCGHVDGAVCRPRTCADVGVTCGPIGDGCGGMLYCGDCTLPDTCGGGGVLGRCGRPVCSHQVCMDQCPGTTFCLTQQDGDRVDSICFDTSSDARNCGGCGITCGLGTCSGGTCHCPAPAMDANGVDAGRSMCPVQGCITCPGLGCINQATDYQNCGACGHACHSGQTCANGVCIP